MPRTIVLNALSILNRSGTGFYVRALVDYLREHPVEGAEVHVCLPDIEDRTVGYLPGGIEFPDGVTAEWFSGDRLRRRGGRVFVEQFGLPRLCRKLGCDVLHSPTGIAPLAVPARSAVTLHDMAFRVYPEDFSFAHRAFVSKFLPRSARRADRVLTDSEWSSGEIERLLGISPGKIRIVPLGVQDRFFRPVSDEDLGRVRTTHSLPPEFILYLGTIEPRKNLVTLVEALSLLRKENVKTPIVIAGRFGWKVRMLMERIEELGIRDAVHFPGFVDDADLPALYRLATVFAYPSKYEGFGLPVLEAMASGKPVVALNRTSIPEVTGDTALLVNENSPEALAEAVRMLLGDEGERERLATAARERARLFPWSRTADLTFRHLVEL
jgi:glycosyltransferase involved in cell wall biosynthesis